MTGAPRARARRGHITSKSAENAPLRIGAEARHLERPNGTTRAPASLARGVSAPLRSEDGGGRSTPPGSSDPLDALPLSEAVDGYKTRRVRQALAQTGGNQSRAAEILGVRQSNLSRLMKALGISLVQ